MATPRIQQLIDRDGGRCVWCAHKPWEQDLTVEHLLPRSRGGRTEPDNLLLACKRCNNGRKSKAALAYVRQLQAAGLTPRLGTLELGLQRLAGSARRQHREYGAAQLRQLHRLRASR